MSVHIVINIENRAAFDEMESRIRTGLTTIPNPDGARIYICREVRWDVLPSDTPLVQIEFSRRQRDSRFAIKLASFINSLNPPKTKPIIPLEHDPHAGTIFAQ
jgi:hypothetical protein